MLKVTAVCYVDADKVDEFLAIAKELVEKTNSLDPGCIKYELCKDLDNPLHFIVLEEWESQSALDDHMQATHFTDLVPKLGEQTTTPIELTLLEKVF